MMMKPCASLNRTISRRRFSRMVTTVGFWNTGTVNSALIWLAAGLLELSCREALIVAADTQDLEADHLRKCPQAVVIEAVGGDDIAGFTSVDRIASRACWAPRAGGSPSSTAGSATWRPGNGPGQAAPGGARGPVTVPGGGSEPGETRWRSAARAGRAGPFQGRDREPSRKPQESDTGRRRRETFGATIAEIRTDGRTIEVDGSIQGILAAAGCPEIVDNDGCGNRKPQTIDFQVSYLNLPLFLSGA
jgi:hypothetical protein